MTRKEAEDLRNDLLQANILEERIAHRMRVDLDFFLDRTNYKKSRFELKILKHSCDKYGWDIAEILDIMKDEL